MKSPLKAKPLRNPGQSLETEIQDVLHDEMLVYYVLALFLSILAAHEWWRWYRDTPPAPILYTALAALAVSVAVWKIRRALKRLKNLVLGRDGERAVGQFLEGLRSSGAEVFHDVPGKNFNIDHVIVHPSGVYVIETKTWSKPDRGAAKLIFNGQSISCRGIEPDRNPVTQAKAAGHWLSELVQESTGRTVPVRSVVVFPGWFIESTAEAKHSEVWVLNPKALPSFIGHSSVQLKSEDVKLVAYHISRYVRAENET